MQRCAQEILRLHLVVWPSYYHAYTTSNDPSTFIWELCTTVGVGRAQLFDWLKPYYWDTTLCDDQVYIDAWTKDGAAILRKGAVGIKIRGQDTVPFENPITNASIGTLPTFSVYTTAQAKVGVTPYFTNNSCTGGRALRGKSRKRRDLDGEGGNEDDAVRYAAAAAAAGENTTMRGGPGYRGFVPWNDTISDESKEHIKRFMYYNRPEAEPKLPPTYRTDPFTAGNFRVRRCPPSHNTAPHATSPAMWSKAQPLHWTGAAQSKAHALLSSILLSFCHALAPVQLCAHGR